MAKGSGGSHIPNPLAPLSPRQIRQQATTTIGAAYKPAYSQLDQQTKTARGISAKRTADNQAYQQWLNTQMGALQAHAESANSALTSLEQGLQAQQQGLYAHQGSDLTAGANARQGNVSANADSTSFGNELYQNQQSNMGQLNSAEQQYASSQKSGNDALSGTAANNYGLIQAAQTKQLSDLDTVLGKLSDARTQLNTKQTADVAKEIARLQGVEIQKAQSNRDYAAAAEKLGLSAANIQSQIQTRSGQLGIAQQNANTSATRANNAQLNADRNYKLNQARYNSQVAKDMYERDHGLGPYRVSKGGKKPSLSITSQNAIYNRISKVRGQVESLISAGYTPTQAWHLLHSGGYVKGPAGASGKRGNVHYAAVGDDGLLNAAYNTRHGAGGLTPGDLNYLKNMGLDNPGSRLPVIPNYYPSPGGAASPH